MRDKTMAFILGLGVGLDKDGREPVAQAKAESPRLLHLDQGQAGPQHRHAHDGRQRPP